MFGDNAVFDVVVTKRANGHNKIGFEVEKSRFYFGEAGFLIKLNHLAASYGLRDFGYWLK
jgi:hypothetical protein